MAPNPTLLSAALNRGHAYKDNVSAADAGQWLSHFYARRYTHSSHGEWRRRIAAGEIYRNGQRLWADAHVCTSDRLIWQRPPWQEAAVPALPGPLFDDGDLLVYNKPSGLQVLPAGGFKEHTVLHQLESQVQAGWLDARAGVPRPVHRLGRHTSGLLVCARQSTRRAWLSARLRESTAQPLHSSCQKIYRALLQPLPEALLPRLQAGQQLAISTEIGRRSHPRLGWIWSAATADQAGGCMNAVSAMSTLTLVERRSHGDLVEVAIASGRPHQIRIHAAALGAPLVGDPLYRPGGLARDDALPGDGGYFLHAHRLSIAQPNGERLQLEAPLPDALL